MDIPFRFIPALIAGLAMVALEAAEGGRSSGSTACCRSYTAQWELAASEDRERASLRLVPERS